MSDNTEIEPINNNTNEWINWIKEAISKKYIKYYEYENFHNIKEISSGEIGKFYRANWKDSYKHLILRSFTNYDDTTVKEIVRELELHHEVDFHENFIQFYGVTTSNEENQIDRYMLVMDDADGGTLQDYLKKNFHNLTWNDKFNLAFQLANAVSYLHEEGIKIVHGDLRSNEEISKNNLREEIIQDTPLGYSNLYTECWKLEPDERPIMSKVVKSLSSMILENNSSTNNYQTIDSKMNNNIKIPSNVNDLLYGGLSQVIQNIEISANEIIESLALLKRSLV
ncbi:unnamed protein product [Rhizophagus irregularis]|nr:unnamed protein product [Rhizophagus irregularis]